jgi:phenylacetate-CoA ligase
MVRKFLYEMYESHFRKRHTFDLLQECHTEGALQADAVRALQLRRLKAILEHCHKNVPFYRKLWSDSGFEWSKVESVGDLQYAPIVSKQDLISAGIEKYCDMPPNNIVRKSTSGSTGRPFQFELDRYSYDRRTALTIDVYGKCGATLYQPVVFLWGTALQHQSMANIVKKKLHDFMLNRVYLSVLGLSESSLKDYVNVINSVKPVSLVGYAKSVYQLARLIKNSGLYVYSPSSIIFGAEGLNQFERNLIEEVFRTKTYDTYGCVEFMSIAYERQGYTGYFCNETQLIVEATGPEGQSLLDATGEIVITDLFNYRMPFIRYANGDMGAVSFQNGHKVLTSIDGRKADIIDTPDGRQITALMFPILLNPFANIEEFQVVRKSISDITLRLKCRSELSGDELNNIQSIVQEKLGPTMAFSIEIINEILLTNAGKRAIYVDLTRP